MNKKILLLVVVLFARTASSSALTSIFKATGSSFGRAVTWLKTPGEKVYSLGEYFFWVLFPAGVTAVDAAYNHPMANAVCNIIATTGNHMGQSQGDFGIPSLATPISDAVEAARLAATPTFIVGKAFTNVTSFVKNHKVECAAAVFGLSVGLLIRITCRTYIKVLTNSLQRLIADVKKAVDGQKKFVTDEELVASEQSDNLYGILDPKNYPCVDKDMIGFANNYICKKNVLLNPRISPQEMLHTKGEINKILAVFKDRYSQQLSELSKTMNCKESSDFSKLNYETMS